MSDDLAMAPTDLSTIQLPDPCRDWARTADELTVITEHAITVNLTWWNESLQARGLQGGPAVGRNPAGDVVDTGYGQIRRGDVFTLAASLDGSPQASLQLLWHTLAWGAGRHVRLVHKRMDAIARDRARATVGLRTAAELSSTDPRSAFETLYPGGSTLIPHLGPSFFTKYLYFAGAGQKDHPCLILDERVAGALKRAGWDSLSDRGPWPADTYARYCGLLGRWAAEIGESGVRPDLLERWLFDEGGPGR